MKDIKISAKNIGSNIVAENAQISTVTGTVDERGDDTEKQLISLLLEQLNTMRMTNTSLSSEQLKSLAHTLANAVLDLQKEVNLEKKKGIIGKALRIIKNTIGVTADAFETFLKLGSLIGIN